MCMEICEISEIICLNYILKKLWCHNSFNELLFVFKDKEDCVNFLQLKQKNEMYRDIF